ncbi:hypothetical protein HDR58_10935 [bacterium]|nr:hypothetical protein [bacterium]
MSSNVGAINGGIVPVNAFQFNNPYDFGYDDLDMDLSTRSGLGGSIFDGYGMMPMTPGIGGTNNQSYFNNMKDYQKFYVDYNVDQQNMQRNADLRINASVEGIRGAAAILQDKIKQNEQDQIPQALNAYIESVSAAYGPGTPKEIKSRALSLYQEMTGKSLIQDLRDNSHSSFTQGALQSMTFSLWDRNSAEDNISALTGQPVNSGDKAAQNLGRVVGAVGVGAAAGGITKLLTKGGQATTQNTNGLAKFFKGNKAGKVGVIVGLVAAGLAFITGKVST